MPLRQSRLNFNHRASDTHTDLVPTTVSHSETSAASPLASTEVDADTIVVDIKQSNPQLPTPSDSATDVSSQSSTSELPHPHILAKGLTDHYGLTNQLSDAPYIRGHKKRALNTPSFDACESTLEARAKRAVKPRKSRFREESVDVTEQTGEDKSRSISGETLVSKHSQSSLLKSGIKALDLEWDLHEENDMKNDGRKAGVADENENESTLIVTPEDVEDEAERTARLAALRARKEENAKKWEQRRKAAEDNATRRSGRASLVIEKAGAVISGIASNVLGKRGRDGGDDKQKTTNKSLSGIATDQEPLTKKVRLREQEKPLPPASKKTSVRGEKKWLVSGLYAGQTRSFDARLTESSNKKKHSSKEVEKPVKENTVLPLPMFAGERLLKQGRDFKLPFDIFSPVPPGQAKPEGWRKQNRNVIVGDAADVWRFDRVQESSKCICITDTGCDHNCLNRTMYYECDNANCNVSATLCGNRQWHELARRVKRNMPYTIGVDVVKTADRGHGVRANRTFEPGQIILEYTGEIITQEECETRMRNDYKTNECYYLMLFDQNMILDATRGSMARFVNHSCEPNCTMEKWTVKGVPRMALFAGDRGIMTGEELTYDYNFDPYSQKNVQQCRCGAKNCRGFLGPKPKDVKQKSPDVDGAERKPEGRIAGAKRKLTEALSESTNMLNKKRKTEPVKLKKSAAKTKQIKGASPKKIVAVKQVAKKKVTVVKTTSKIVKHRNSALKKIIADTKRKTTMTKGRRIISAGSMGEALLPKESFRKSTKTINRSSSLKEKATHLKKSIVASVRGRSK